MAEHDILPSNANKLRSIGSRSEEIPRAERPHAKQIATRVINTKPDSAGKRFIKLFLAEDVDDLGEYLIRDLIVPGVKDVFFNFLWALFWGDKRSGSASRSDKTPYYKASQMTKIRTIGASKKEEQEEPKDTQKFDLSNLRFASQAEARDVLDSMKIYLESYPGVSIGYLQELLGETGDYTNEYYGWTNLQSATIRPTSGGRWLLVLPRPERL